MAVTSFQAQARPAPLPAHRCLASPALVVSPRPRAVRPSAAGSAGFGVTSPGYEDYEAAHSSRLPPVRAAAEAARPEIRTHYVETPNKNSKLQAWAEKEWTSLLKLGALTIVNLIAYHYASGNQMPGFFLAGTILYWMRCAERLFHSWRGRPRMVPAGEDKRYVGFIIASGLCCLLFFRA